jgi:ribosome maturation factor RimP
LVNQAEVMILPLGGPRGNCADPLGDLKNLDRLRAVRTLNCGLNSQISLAQAKDSHKGTLRSLIGSTGSERPDGQSVDDVATVHRNLQRTVEPRPTWLLEASSPGLQRDLLRTRMVSLTASQIALAQGRPAEAAKAGKTSWTSGA